MVTVHQYLKASTLHFKQKLKFICDETIKNRKSYYRSSIRWTGYRHGYDWMKYGPGKNGQQFKPTEEHFGHDHVDTEFTVIWKTLSPVSDRPKEDKQYAVKLIILPRHWKMHACHKLQ